MGSADRIEKWEAIATQVMVDAPGAELPAVVLAIQRAARDFYTRSHSWREVVDPLVTVAGIPDYDVLDVKDVEVIAVRGVSVGRDTFDGNRGNFDRYLTPEQMQQQHVAYPDRRGPPECAAHIDDRLWFYPTPATSGERIGATLVLRPTYALLGLPRRQFTEHQDAIAVGALWYLKKSIGKPYSDPAGAGAVETAFIYQASHYRNQADTGGAEVPRETTTYFV